MVVGSVVRSTRLPLCSPTRGIRALRHESLWIRRESRISSVRCPLPIRSNPSPFSDVCLCAVSGIGHKIKSVNNPDHRVQLVKEYVQKNFPSHSLLDYALGVEKVTTAKKDTVSPSIPICLYVGGSLTGCVTQLILNVDGCVAVCFVDLLRDSGAFTPEEAEEYIKVSPS